MKRQTRSPGVRVPELTRAIIAYLAKPPEPAPEPERYVQDPLPGMEPQS